MSDDNKWGSEAEPHRTQSDLVRGIDARWGGAETPRPPNWAALTNELPDPDDEQLEQTPQDVIDMLGFDPAGIGEG